MRAAIVGCGSIARVHAKSILALGHELAALADIDPDHLDKFSQEFGGTPYSSLEAMLDNECIDVLHICTPHYLHVPMAIYALKKGVNVFMEKPPVISNEQLVQLEDALSGAAKKLGFCFQNRYNPAVVMARQILQSGEAGEVLGARGYVTWNRGINYYSDPWHGKLALEGGGVLINQAIHTLDLLHCFIGKTPISIDALIANHRLKSEIEVEDTVSALITYPNASLSFYATNSYSEDSPALLEVKCENLHLRLEGNTLFCKQQGGAWEQIEVTQPQALGKSYWGVGHIICIEDFYRCIQENQPFALELSGVKDTIRLTMDIYQSARENRTVLWEE